MIKKLKSREKKKKPRERFKVSRFKFVKKNKKERKQSKRMSPLHNMSIGWKYGAAFIFIFILLFLSTVLIGWSIQESQRSVEQLERRGDRAVFVTELSAQIQAKALSANTYSQFWNQTHYDDYMEASEEVNQLLDYLGGELNNHTQEALYQEVLDNNYELDEMFEEDIADAMDEPENVMSIYSNRFNNLASSTSLYLEYLRDSILEERDEALDDAHSAQMLAQTVLYSAMLVSFVIGVVLFLLISRHVSKHLKSVVTVSDQIASGDLTVESVSYQGKDEIGRLASSMDKMRLNLTQMIDQIKQTSNLVNTQSEDLNQSADDVRQGTEQIAATMEELSSGTETQANAASDLAGTMKAFAEKIQSINTSGETISTSTSNVLDETHSGNEYMNRSIEQMGSIDAIVKQAVSKVSGLDDESKQISKLVGVIKDIADQTNLLALNAAIEAARAGESGKGFAVVADEVRKLAEQVGESVVDITEIVNRIQLESKAVSEALEKGYKEVAQGTEDIHATGVRFEAIEKAIHNMTDHVNSVMSGLEELASDSESVNDSVQEIASISEESAAGVEETSASAEEASSSMEEVSTGSKTLRKSAAELDQLVKQFKI
ncbi:methyl-accepting chemotaxis protein [Pelagirhabdus alkalitolerans]|uniref:Methyl-accepting chemotaxis protein n=1 Tax=Pelagirhabdus alkalitolerans TaxID=1612202 RepID=A0A1G6IFC8_9BACI|nr:methyl-accepting chemotaxis protein [Pelagirhabdus alkalitolerans]SDC05174.1 methyl-accepting chemotaxis protein [Pelagirhabdus alkalitolerans]